MLCQEQWRLIWLTWLVACLLSPLFLSPSSRVSRGQADEPVARSHAVSSRFRSYTVRVAFAARACVALRCIVRLLAFQRKPGRKTLHVRAPEKKAQWPLSAIGESFLVTSLRRVVRVVKRESAYALSLPSVFHRSRRLFVRSVIEMIFEIQNLRQIVVKFKR